MESFDGIGCALKSISAAFQTNTRVKIRLGRSRRRFIVRRAILSNWNHLSTAYRFGTLPTSNRRTQTMPPPPATLDRLDLPLCVDLDGTLIKSDLVWEIGR